MGNLFSLGKMIVVNGADSQTPLPKFALEFASLAQRGWRRNVDLQDFKRLY